MLLRNEGFRTKDGLRQATGGSWSGANRRQYPRFDQSLDVTYGVIKKPSYQNLSGKTVDISESGVKLALDEKLSPGTFISLKIALPGSNKVSELVGNIVWTEDATDIADPSGKRFFYSGIRFVSPGEPSGMNLINHIRSITSHNKT
jgi:hypothetical protein